MRVMEKLWCKINPPVLPDKMLLRQNFDNLRGASKAPFGQQFRFYALELFLTLQFFPVAYDLTTVLDDIAFIGDDLCVLTGILMVLMKRWHCRSIVDQLDECVQKFDEYYVHYRSRGTEFSEAIRRETLPDRIFSIASTILGGMMCGFFIMRELLSDGESHILRAKFPFNTDTPVGHWFVFASQAILLCHSVVSTVVLENFSTEMLSQLSVLFVLLRMEFEQVAKGHPLPRSQLLYYDEAIAVRIKQLIVQHQQLLSFADRVKELYETNIMGQFVASSIIICMTAFEVMFAKGQMIPICRFGAYMAICFHQIFVWCFVGDRMTHTSTSIHEAIFACNWIVLDNGLKKDLGFAMMRAQQPYVINVYGMFPLTFAMFIAISSRAYSVMTLMQSMIE
ncbi:odorant receptor 47b-like [Anopheles bellator]|uniref:odorant receptor 47b-like n=1 Tax=Anopheles bellator TaxID=139047 RepID=UPI0026491815|nr:odorant receptor 47b-like [Anopheles bellator]